MKLKELVDNLDDLVSPLTETITRARLVKRLIMLVDYIEQEQTKYVEKGIMDSRVVLDVVKQKLNKYI
jgi:hypothetical protein